ncbi:hypothetical protein FB107DRAFT_250928 [Schizophyllum commune]
MTTLSLTCMSPITYALNNDDKTTLSFRSPAYPPTFKSSDARAPPSLFSRDFLRFTGEIQWPGCGGKLNVRSARSSPHLPTFRWVGLVADRRGLIRKYATPFWKFGRRVGTAFDRSRSIKVLSDSLLLHRFLSSRAPSIDTKHIYRVESLSMSRVRYGLPRRLEMPAALNFNTSCCTHTMLLDVLAAVAMAVNVAQATSGALALSLHPHHIDTWTILKRGWRDRDGGAHSVRPTALHVPGINRTSRHVVGVLGERSELTWARHLPMGSTSPLAPTSAVVLSSPCTAYTRFRSLMDWRSCTTTEATGGAMTAHRRTSIVECAIRHDKSQRAGRTVHEAISVVFETAGRMRGPPPTHFAMKRGFFCLFKRGGGGVSRLTAMLRMGVYARANDIPTPLFVLGESSKRRKDGEAADLSYPCLNNDTHALVRQGQHCPSFCSPSVPVAALARRLWARDKCRLSIGRVVIELEYCHTSSRLASRRLQPPQDEGARPIRGIFLKSNPFLIAQCDRRGRSALAGATSHRAEVQSGGLCVVLASLPDYLANRCSALARYTSFSSVRRFRFRVLLVDPMSGKTSTRRSTGGDDFQALGNFVCS